MTARRYRRIRVRCLRAFSLLRRHHLSLVSAGVLSIALAVALTDSGFSDRPAMRAQPATAAREAPVTPRSAAWHVYYLVRTPEQARAISSSIRADALYVSEYGEPARNDTLVYFMLFGTPEQEAEGARFLAQVSEMAPREGFNLKVVDLTH